MEGTIQVFKLAIAPAAVNLYWRGECLQKVIKKCTEKHLTGSGAEQQIAPS